MKPYYEHAGITIYHGNCREVLQCINTSKVDLVMADPPYGIGYKPRGSQSLNGFIVKRNFGSKDRLQGDSGKLDFDPSVITSKFKKVNQCWWGANNYADSLPRSKGWLVWYKADGMEGTKYGHAEIAWTNINMPIRGINFLWMGCAGGG